MILTGTAVSILPQIAAFRNDNMPDTVISTEAWVRFPGERNKFLVKFGFMGGSRVKRLINDSYKTQATRFAKSTSNSFWAG